MVKIKILGMDQATHNTGFSVFDGNSLVDYGINTVEKNEDSTERINLMKKFLKKLIDKHAPDIVVLENTQLQYIFNPKTKSSTVIAPDDFRLLSKLLGVMEDYCFENEICFVTIFSTEWKSKCKIKGRKREEQKLNAIAFIEKQFGIEVSSDIADAICIGWWGVKKYIN